ncbi:MAG: hypothetical protein Q9157_000477 [Trypethelium eluteriae]
MSQSREVETENTLHHNFEFPLDYYLSITTENRILSWDANDLRTIFQSKSGGILSAKAIEDGGSKLAVADSQVVLLHDYERGSSKTYNLKGFSDGTVAAYDATKVFGDGSIKTSAELAKSGGMGEIGHLKKLHGVITRQETKGNTARGEGSIDVLLGSRAESVTAAAFMPGHKARAVTVGADAKCRLIDFRGGSTILRTWKMRAPATSLSILSLKSDRRTQSQLSHDGPKAINQKRSRQEACKDTASSSNMLTDSLLAVGRVDGKVALFDSVGTWLTEREMDPQANPVIDVEWVQGAIPKPILESGGGPDLLHSRDVGPEIDDQTSRESRAELRSPGASPTGTKRKHSGTAYQVTGGYDQEEGEANFKRRARSPTVGDRGLAQPIDYLDLFSPVKKNLPPDSGAGNADSNAILRKKSVSFEQNEVVGRQSDPPSPPTKPSLSSPPNDLSERAKSVTSSQEDSAQRGAQSNAIRPSTVMNKSFRRMGSPFMDDANSLDSSNSIDSRSDGASLEHSNLLADLKRIGNRGSSSNRSGTALFAPYMKPALKPSIRNDKDREENRTSHSKTSHSKNGSSELENSSSAVKSESSSTSGQSNGTSEDIWLESSSPAKHSRSRRRPPLPPRSALNQTATASPPISPKNSLPSPSRSKSPPQPPSHPALRSDLSVNPSTTEPFPPFETASVPTDFSGISPASSSTVSPSALKPADPYRNVYSPSNRVDTGPLLFYQEAIEHHPPPSRRQSIANRLKPRLTPSNAGELGAEKNDGKEGPERRTGWNQVKEVSVAIVREPGDE